MEDTFGVLGLGPLYSGFFKDVFLILALGTLNVVFVRTPTDSHDGNPGKRNPEGGAWRCLEPPVFGRVEEGLFSLLRKDR